MRHIEIHSGDGTIQNYPFNNQGLFDYKAYYQGTSYITTKYTERIVIFQEIILINSIKCMRDIKRKDLCKRHLRKKI